MSHSEVKKRLDLIKAYKNDLLESEREALTDTLKSYVNRCISSCEDEEFMYCADVSKKINN